VSATTFDRERYWSAVDEALDTGADPLAVPFVQEWIAEHPADGDALARMLRRVEAVSTTRRTARRKVALAAAGVLLAGAAVPVIALRSSSPPTPAPPSAVRSCILEYSLEVVREGVDSSSTVLAEPGRTARSHMASIGATTIVCSLEGNLP
jgi:hypothetical protein